VVAASAVVGLVGKEGVVIRKTLLPFVYYAMLTGAIGYWIVWHVEKGVVNVGAIIALLIAASAVYIISSNRKRLIQERIRHGDSIKEDPGDVS